MEEEEAFDLSLEDALASAETGAQSLEGGCLNIVHLPNRFNGWKYWFASGEIGKLPTKKVWHRKEAGILTLVRLHGLNPQTGWRAI